MNAISTPESLRRTADVMEAWQKDQTTKVRRRSIKDEDASWHSWIPGIWMISAYEFDTVLTPKLVDLRPEDVPLEAGIKLDIQSHCWKKILEVNSDGIETKNDEYTFNRLKTEGWFWHAPGQDRHNKPCAREEE